MVKMIHALTGTVMYVAEARREEYLAAGHYPAENPAPAQEREQEKKPAQTVPSPAAKPAPAAKSAAKPAAKKAAPVKKR